MTLYENAATAALINLFTSPNREEYKTKCVYNFLLQHSKKKFEDIETVEEQKQNSAKNSIPDFNIILTDGKEIKYEVKINNAYLTDSEQIGENRDVFLICESYKYKDEIPKGKHILLWEDLFDELDEQDIVIDSLDILRNKINYPKQNLNAKMWEVIANLQYNYPNTKIDLDNTIIDSKFHIYIPLFPDDNNPEWPLLTIEVESNSLVLYKNNEKEYQKKFKLPIKEFKRKRSSDIANIIYEKIYKSLCINERNSFNLTQTLNQVYSKIIKSLTNDKTLNKCYDGYNSFYFDETIYSYFVMIGADKFELGFGNLEQPFSKKTLENLKDKKDKAIKLLKDNEIISNKLVSNFNNEKWVGARFSLINTDINQIKEHFKSAMKIMLEKNK